MLGVFASSFSSSGADTNGAREEGDALVDDMVGDGIGMEEARGEWSEECFKYHDMLFSLYLHRRVIFQISDFAQSGFIKSFINSEYFVFP